MSSYTTRMAVPAITPSSTRPLLPAPRPYTYRAEECTGAHTATRLHARTRPDGTADYVRVVRSKER